mgnify:CR=1 FL=1
MLIIPMKYYFIAYTKEYFYSLLILAWDSLSKTIDTEVYANHTESLSQAMLI